jgi:hypothetical protein
VRGARIWQRMLCAEETVVEDVWLEEDRLVVSVRPYRLRQQRWTRSRPPRPFVTHENVTRPLRTQPPR